MEIAFDHSASSYDQHFTKSQIGRMQRQRVWNYLKKTLPAAPLNILELSCGTGEDALFLSKMGHHVTATDLSKEMIQIARNKKQGHSIEFNVMAIEEAVQKSNEKKYDLVFSNFGGFNCLSPEQIKKFIGEADQLLNANGRFVAVIMPSYCVQESMYFLLKRKWKQIFRRMSNKAVLANVAGHSQNTWYYGPGKLKKMLPAQLHLHAVKPIGFFIPPSYMESFVQPKKVLLKSLNGLEVFTGNWSLLSAFSDHYLIDIRKKA